MPSMGGGGAERVLINLFNLIDFKKFDIELLVLMNKGKLWNDIPISVKKKHLGLSSNLLKAFSYLYRIFYINVFWLFGNQIKGKYDVGISFMDSIFTEFLFLDSLKLNKRVTIVHSSYKSYINRSKFIKGRYKKLMTQRYSKLDKIICVSEESKKEFIELFGKNHNIETIYNPLDHKDILNKANIKRPSLMTKSKFQMVAVGSLIPVKGYDLLIKSISLLKKERDDFQLHILGDGFLKTQLSKLIEELDLSDVVILHGFVKNPYVWIKNSNLFVMSSLVEGLPTVLCESLILGRPALVPDVPGCREVIGYGDFGILCERTENDFFLNILNCINNPNKLKFYSNKSVERSKTFSDKASLKKYHKVFNDNIKENETTK